jgi:hypothetical protein
MKITLNGGHFGGDIVDVKDTKKIIEKTDDAGGVWLYDYNVHKATTTADFVGMKTK